MTLLLFAVVLLSAVLHALWNLAAKKAAGNLGALWLGICLAALLFWPWAFWVQRTAPLTARGALYIAATDLLHAWYFGFLGHSYALGDISLVYPVARGTGVAGTALLAWLVLQEHLSLSGVGGIAAICLGTLLLGLGPRRQAQPLAAYGQALCVGLTIMSYAIIDKLAVGQVHPVLYISGMFSLTGLLLTPYVLRWHWAACVYAAQHLKTLMVIIGLGSIGTYLMILFTYRLGPVSYIVAVREFAVVIGALLGVVLLNERLSLRKSLGIASITLGLGLVKMAA
ncbi:MAG: EamA family transporter [Candidatus Tectimicrobiota bacterium]